MFLLLYLHPQDRQTHWISPCFSNLIITASVVQIFIYDSHSPLKQKKNLCTKYIFFALILGSFSLLNAFPISSHVREEPLKVKTSSPMFSSNPSFLYHHFFLPFPPPIPQRTEFSVHIY